MISGLFKALEGTTSASLVNTLSPVASLTIRILKSRSFRSGTCFVGCLLSVDGVVVAGLRGEVVSRLSDRNAPVPLSIDASPVSTL